MGTPGRGVVAGFAAHALGFEALADVGELGVGIDLEGKLGAARLIALVELHHEVADLGRQMHAAVLPRRDREPDDLGEIIDLPLKVGRLEGGVAESLSLDHCGLRLGRSIGAGLWVSGTIEEATVSFQLRRQVERSAQEELPCRNRNPVPHNRKAQVRGGPSESNSGNRW